MERQHSPKQVVPDFESYQILLDDSGEKRQKTLRLFQESITDAVVETERQYQGTSSSQVDANVSFSCGTHTSALMNVGTGE